MAKNIKFLYKKHISDTAPDMEKLWDRIEGQLENKTDKDQTQIKSKPQKLQKICSGSSLARAYYRRRKPLRRYPLRVGQCFKA